MVRQKIEMTLVKNKEARMVTFSKRRNGLFKKANELSILCGVQVGIAGFSVSGKPFSFGCPNIEAVIDGFLHKGRESGGRGQCEPSENGKIDKLSKEFEDLMKQLQVEKKKEKLDNDPTKNQLIKGKVPVADAGLDLEELQKLKVLLKQLRDDLKLKLSLTDMEAASSLLLLAKKPVSNRGFALSNF